MAPRLNRRRLGGTPANPGTAISEADSTDLIFETCTHSFGSTAPSAIETLERAFRQRRAPQALQYIYIYIEVSSCSSTTPALTMLSALLLSLALLQTSRAAVIAGSTTADVYPPPGVTPNTALFPPESVVGYAGPTPTGAEPFAYETSPPQRFAKSQDLFSPLVNPVLADASVGRRLSERLWALLNNRPTTTSSRWSIFPASGRGTACQLIPGVLANRLPSHPPGARSIRYTCSSDTDPDTQVPASRLGRSQSSWRLRPRTAPSWALAHFRSSTRGLISSARKS